MSNISQFAIEAELVTALYTVPALKPLNERSRAPDPALPGRGWTGVHNAQASTTSQAKGVAAECCASCAGAGPARGLARWGGVSVGAVAVAVSVSVTV